MAPARLRTHYADNVTLLRLARLALWLALAAIGVLFVLAVLYLARGSLEQFPTAEDHEKVRLVAGAGAVLLLGAGGALVVLLRRVSMRLGRAKGTR
jgi:hypothetical protein